MKSPCIQIVILLIIVCLLVIVDQSTKAVVRTAMEAGESISLIGNGLKITFAKNDKGFSWWVPELPFWAKWVFQFVLLCILLSAFPYYLFYTRTAGRSVWTDISVVGISAACCGHLIDDLFVSYTTDFIQLLDSPCCNFADLYAYTGILSISILVIQTCIRKRSRWKGCRHLLSSLVRTRKAFMAFIKKGMGFLLHMIPFRI